MAFINFIVKYFNNTTSLSIFLKEVRKYKVLTEPEEKELICKWKDCDNHILHLKSEEKVDKEAVKTYETDLKIIQDKLINCNLRYIYSEAKKYARDEDEVLDYVNEGVEGMMASFKSYNPALGYRLMTHSRWYIQRSMNAYLNKMRDMIIPANADKYGKKIENLKCDFYNKNGRFPTIEEIKDGLKKNYNIKVKDDSDIYDVNVTSISYEFDDGYSVTDTSEFGEKTSTYNEYEDDINKEYAKSCTDNIFSMISERHATIIKMLFGIGCKREYSVDEIADRFHIEPSDVNSIKKQIFDMVTSRVSIS